MPDPKIANPDRPRSFLRIQPLQRPPQLLPCGGPSARRMNQEKIHIPLLPANHLDALEALLIRLFGAASGGKDLGGEEDLVTRDSGLAHRVAHLRFVGVVLRAVDVAIAGLQRGETGLEAYFGRGEIDSEAEAGDFEGVVGKREGGCYGEGCGFMVVRRGGLLVMSRDWSEMGQWGKW